MANKIQAMKYNDDIMLYFKALKTIISLASFYNSWVRINFNIIKENQHIPF